MGGVEARLTQGLKRFELLRQRDVVENYRRAANSPLLNRVTSPSPATRRYITKPSNKKPTAAAVPATNA